MNISKKKAKIIAENRLMRKVTIASLLISGTALIFSYQNFSRPGSKFDVKTGICALGSGAKSLIGKLNPSQSSIANDLDCRSVVSAQIANVDLQSTQWRGSEILYSQLNNLKIDSSLHDGVKFIDTSLVSFSSNNTDWRRTEFSLGSIDGLNLKSGSLDQVVFSGAGQQMQLQNFRLSAIQGRQIAFRNANLENFNFSSGSLENSGFNLNGNQMSSLFDNVQGSNWTVSSSRMSGRISSLKVAQVKFIKVNGKIKWLGTSELKDSSFQDTTVDDWSVCGKLVAQNSNWKNSSIQKLKVGDITEPSCGPSLVDLGGAKLAGMKLVGEVHKGSVLNLAGADLTGADLSQLKNYGGKIQLQGAHLKGAVFPAKKVGR